MTFQQISEQYPRAFEAWIEWLDLGNLKFVYINRVFTDVTVIRIGEEYSIRNFYDFFDSVNMPIGIQLQSINEAEQKNKITFKDINCFFFEICNKFGEEISDSDLYRTRKEAEFIAFQKAFELLEGRLKETTS